MHSYSEQVEKIITMSMNDKEITQEHYDLYADLIGHYFFVKNLNTNVYNEAQQYKNSFFSDIIPENSFAIKINGVSPQFYHNKMLDVVIQKSVPYRTLKVSINGAKMTDEKEYIKVLAALFTEQDIENNTLGQAVEVQYEKNEQTLKKTYPAGMKITRFFVSFLELIDNKNRENEKAIGKFRLSQTDLVDIYISKFLPSFIMSGLIGSSCLSPEGSNEHSPIITSGYPNVAVVHDSTFEHRAWLFIDNKMKYYALAKTYPYENYYMQLAVIEHMDKLGYTRVTGNYFMTPAYTDLSAAQGLFIDKPIRSEDDTHYLHNYDATAKYHGDILDKHTHKDYVRETVAEYYECDSCNNKSCNPDFIYGDGYCERCYEDNENYFYCESCGDREHNDYGYYDEETGYMYCSSCHRDLIEKREAEAEAKENESNKEVEDSENDEEQKRLDPETYITNTHITNGAFRHYTTSAEFIGLKIKTVQDIFEEYLSRMVQDFSFLRLTDQVVLNQLDYYVLMTIAERAGYSWTNGEAPKEFDTIALPSAIRFFQDRTMLYRAESTIGSTDYRQFFKAALNIALMNKKQEPVNRNAAAEVNDIIMPFMNTEIHFEDFFSLGVDKKFQFEDQKTYEAFLIIIEKLGCIWQSKNRPRFFEYDYLPGNIIVITKDMEMFWGSSHNTGFYTFKEISKFVREDLRPLLEK